MYGKRLLAITTIGFCLSSGAALACETYELTDDERRYLKSVNIDLSIPAMPFAADPAHNQKSAAMKSCFLRSDFNGDGVADFVGIHQHTRGRGKGYRWAFDLVVVYSVDGETRHSVFPSSGQADMDKGLMHHFLVQQPPGTVDLQPGEIRLEQPGVIAYRDGAPAVLYYWNGERFTLRSFFVDD